MSSDLCRFICTHICAYATPTLKRRKRKEEEEEEEEGEKNSRRLLKHQHEASAKAANRLNKSLQIQLASLHESVLTDITSWVLTFFQLGWWVDFKHHCVIFSIQI